MFEQNGDEYPNVRSALARKLEQFEKVAGAENELGERTKVAHQHAPPAGLGAIGRNVHGGGGVMRIKGIIVLASAAAMGCMHGGAQGEAKSSTVSEADVGRLGPEQEALVDQARRDLASAADALSRTNLRLEQAHNEEGTAKADQQAAAADQKVADAQQKVANDSRAPDALEKARQLQEQAKAHKQLADAHLEYASKLIDQRKAELQAAEQQVKVAQARVEWSKLQALEQAKNPVVAKYDPGRFQTAVSDAQKDLDKATQKARDLEAQATAARQRWEDLRGRLGTTGSSDRDQPGTGNGK